jgi:hypothetical protein
MQSGKIAPVIRLFFGNTRAAANTQKDSHSQQNGGYQRPERDPTEDEVKTVLEALNNSEDFKKNTITARLASVQGKFFLEVVNAAGVVLKTIRGGDIFALLLQTVSPNASRQGRILDRRI